MRTFCLILVLTSVMFAGTQVPQALQADHKAPAVELAEIQAQIASLKAAGQAADPALIARAGELAVIVNSHRNAASDARVSAIQPGDFAPGAVIRPTELTPLEERIRNLEFQLSGGVSGQYVDPVTYANLKAELGELYAQRPENREGRDHLDQGADACPGTLITSVPYVDSGTTAGAANDYDVVGTPCGSGHIDSPDVVYEFIPPFTGDYTVSLCSSWYDTYVWINTGGACPGNTQVACNDNFCGSQSNIVTSFTAGTSYYIIVDGDGGSGAYTISIAGACTIVCEPTDVLECAGEVNGPGHETTDCNGGCNNLIWGGPDNYQAISAGQTICGRGFDYTTTGGITQRDLDEYLITLTEACSLAISLASESSAQILVTPQTCGQPLVYLSPIWSAYCSTATFITPCVQPGSYRVRVSTLFSSEVFRDYRLRVDLIPCVSCISDYVLVAPDSIEATTCGMVNNNTLRPSEDFTVQVDIPYEADWTFSVCDDDTIWDSYIYLTTECNTGILAEDDDGCGGVGLSTISCAHLFPGTYYLTVEGFHFQQCGTFVLSVTECLGRCCYGDPLAPECGVMNSGDCSALDGIFYIREDCSTICQAHYGCQEFSQYGQYPYLPGEIGAAYWSHVDLGWVHAENYTVGSPIGSLRVWGVVFECSHGVPETFQVVFASATDTCSYLMTTTGVVLPEVYYTTLHGMQYDFLIDPPCDITSGSVSVAKVGDPECWWSWQTSNYGDSIHLTNAPIDFAFCLGGVPNCPPVDSLTIIRQAPDDYVLRWWQPQDGTALIYVASDPNAVWPGGFGLLGTLYGTAGSQNGSFLSPAAFSSVVIVLDCGPVPTAADLNRPRLFRSAEESK